MSVRFAGYAAVFDRPDRGGDVVRKGAFAESLKRASEVPLLWQHKAGAVVGRIEHLSEDRFGAEEGGCSFTRCGRLHGVICINSCASVYNLRHRRKREKALASLDKF